MPLAWAAVLLASMVVILALAGLSAAVRAYFRHRGTRLIVCPETKATVAVEVDAVRAAWSAAFGEANLQLRDCSRWPERRGCGQECLAEIESAPESCLVRTILRKWYSDKKCVLCGKELEAMDWTEHKPALMGPDRITLEWRDVEAKTIPEVLATHLPVCWNCHVAETFRRRYPELVVDRPWRHGDREKSLRSS